MNQDWICRLCHHTASVHEYDNAHCDCFVNGCSCRNAKMIISIRFTSNGTSYPNLNHDASYGVQPPWDDTFMPPDQAVYEELLS